MLNIKITKEQQQDKNYINIRKRRKKSEVNKTNKNFRFNLKGMQNQP